MTSHTLKILAARIFARLADLLKPATVTSPGLMSPDDKQKLDNITNSNTPNSKIIIQ